MLGVNAPELTACVATTQPPPPPLEPPSSSFEELEELDEFEDVAAGTLL